MNTPKRTATKPRQVIIIPDNSPGLRTSLFKHQRTRPLLVLLSLLAILVVLHNIASANLPVPPVADCSNLLHTTNYVNLLHLRSPDQQLGAISYQEGLIPGRPVALIPTINAGQPATRDLSIYSCTLQGKTPRLLYIASWPKLVNSSVSISKAGTLLISDLEGNHQVYHEYSWQQKAFVETVFPALYPVLSRAEAEQLQGQVSKQDTLPWHDPRGTAERLALQVFGWSQADFEANIQAENADSIEVTLLHRNPTITVIVTLQQLITSNPDGLWFVTSAQTPGMVLNQPAAASSVHSPISLQGSGIQAKSRLSLRLLDSSFQVIRGTTPGSVSTDRSKRFSGSLSYGSEAANQAGMIVIQGAGKKKPYQAGEIMLSKVLLG